MELLYILLIIIGILCFFHCVKYIFRDTNRLYHYQEDYVDQKDHFTDIDDKTRSITRYNMLNPTMKIEEYHTIILSDMNILQNCTPALPANPTSESQKILGIYNYIKLEDYAQFLKLHPNAHDDSNISKKLPTDIINDLINKLSNIAHNHKSTSWKKENISLYYKYSNDKRCPEAGYRTGITTGDKIHLLIFNHHSATDTEHSATDTEHSATDPEHYNVYITDWLGVRGYSLSPGNDSFNLKLMNDNIYKKLLSNDVIDISDKLVYSSLNTYLDISSPGNSAKQPHAGALHGSLFMYGINRYHESYYVDKKKKFKKIDLSPKFSNKPHSLYLHKKTPEGKNSVFDRWVLEKDNDDMMEVHKIENIRNIRKNQTLQKIFDGNYTLLHETDNHLIYLNDKYNTYIKLILNDKSVKSNTKNNSLGFFRYNDMDLTFDIDYKHDFGMVGPPNSKKMTPEEEEEGEDEYDLEMRSEQHEKKAIENSLMKTKETHTFDNIKKYLSVLFKEFNVYVGYINPDKCIPGSFSTMRKKDFISHINNNNRNGFIDLYRLCNSKNVVSFMYMDNDMSVNTGKKSSAPDRRPLIDLKYNMTMYFDDNDIEYKVYKYPSQLNLSDIIKQTPNKPSNIDTAKLFKLVQGKKKSGKSVYDISTELDKNPNCVGFVVESGNINDNDPNNNNNNNIKYTTLTIPPNYTNQYDFDDYLNTITITNPFPQTDKKGQFVRLFYKKKYLKDSKYDEMSSWFTNTVESAKDTILCNLFPGNLFPDSCS